MPFSLFPRSGKGKRPAAQHNKSTSIEPTAHQPSHAEREVEDWIPLGRRPKHEPDDLKHFGLCNDSTLSENKRNGLFLGRRKGTRKFIEGSSSSGTSLVADPDELPEGELSGYEADSSSEPISSSSDSVGSNECLPGSPKFRYDENEYNFDLSEFVSAPQGEQSEGSSMGGGVALSPPNLPERGPVPTLPPVVPMDIVQSSDSSGKPDMDQERRDTRGPVPDADRMAEIYDTAARDRHRSIAYQILDGTATPTLVGRKAGVSAKQSMPDSHAARRKSRHWSHRRTSVFGPSDRDAIIDVMPQLCRMGHSPAGAPPTRTRSPPVLTSRWSSSASASTGETEKSESGSGGSVPAIMEVRSMSISMFRGAKKLWL